MHRDDAAGAGSELQLGHAQHGAARAVEQHIIERVVENGRAIAVQADLSAR